MRIDRRVLPGTTFDDTGSQAIIHADQNPANARGANAVDLQSVRTLATQVASGPRTFIGSGQNNLCSGTSSGIVCGDTNTNTGLNSLIACGLSNSLTASTGGCFIGTGFANSIPGFGALNSIITGFLNSMGITVVGSAIVTGNACSITSGSYNGILAADQCILSGTGSAIVAGVQCNVAGVGATVVGGNGHVVDCDYSAIISGVQNSITSGRGFFANTIINGNLNNIGTSRQYCQILNGVGNSVEDNFTTIIHGSFVECNTPREIAWGGVSDSEEGRGLVQNSNFVLSIDTTNATTTRTSVDSTTASTTNQINIPTDRTLSMLIHVTAMEQRTGGSDSASFLRRVVIQNLNGTTALVGSVQTIGTDIGSNAGSPPAGWAVSITADNTNDQLNLSVTGAAATNIRWVARVESSQAGYT